MATVIPSELSEIFGSIANCIDSHPDEKTIISVLDESVRNLFTLIDDSYGVDWLIGDDSLPLPATKQAIERMGYEFDLTLNKRGALTITLSYRYYEIGIGPFFISKP